MLKTCKIGYSFNFSYNILLAALLLFDKNIDYDQEDKLQKGIGISIEKGDYSSYMDKTGKNLYTNY